MVLLRVIMVFMLATPLGAQSSAEAALAAAKAAIRVQDYTGALAILEPPELAHSAEVLLMQASLYQAGRGVARDDAKAFLLTQSAAALGSVDAQYNLGRLLLSGRGVEANRENGQAWVARAAEGGHIRAAALLVNLLQSRAVQAPAPVVATVMPAAVQGSEISRRMGWTPLMEAARRGQPKLLETLLASSNIEAQDSEGRTALMHAVEAEDEVAVDMLIRAGADLQAVDKKGNTALSFAAQAGDELVLRILLAMGALPNAPNASGQTPLEMAIIAAQGDAAALMLNKRGLALADAAVQKLWFLAAGHGTAALFEALDMHGAHCGLQDSNQLSALTHAAQAGNTALLSYCLSQGAPLDAALLVSAAQSGQTAFAMALLAAGSAPDGESASGNSALLIAANSGDNLLVQALLNRGADVDHRNQAGNSALMLAAQNGAAEIVSILRRAGADTSLRNKLREQALDIARAAGHLALVALLE